MCKDGYQGNGKTCTGRYHVSWIYKFNELKIFKRYLMLYCMFLGSLNPTVYDEQVLFRIDEFWWANSYVDSNTKQ